MGLSKRAILPVTVFGIIVGLLAMFALMGRYEAKRRTERLDEYNKRFASIAEKLNDMEAVRRIPVSFKDRVLPLDSMARSLLRELSGSRSLFKQDPVLVFLTLCFDGVDSWKDVPLINVQYGDNKELLGMESADSLVSLQKVQGSEKFKKRLSELQAKDSADILPVESEVFMINSRAAELENQFSHRLLIAPPWKSQRANPQTALDWHSPVVKQMSGHPREKAEIVDKSWFELSVAWEKRDMAGVNAATKTLTETCKELAGEHWPVASDVETELSFNKVNPLTRSSYIAFAASLFMLFGVFLRSKALRLVGLVVSAIALGFILYGFYVRTTLGFGVAITNLYESMVSVAGLCLLLGLILDLACKSSWFTISGGLATFFVLQVVDLFSVKYDAGIGGTIAVLANNFWVHIHVPIVMASYTAFVIAFILSIVGLAWYFSSDPKTPDPEFKSLVRAMEIVVNLGSVFIFAGLVLGGVWAHDSWGRFWGWDPKETWAAILFVWYMIIVHGRFTKAMPVFWSLWWSFGGGAILLFAYYGTNELLAGLHSYANSALSGGFWANAMHEKNRWFIWSMGTLIVSWLGILGLYYALGFANKAPKEVVETEASPKIDGRIVENA